MDSGNTAWVLASGALVLFMTPGLAFFYGGMVRSKNVLGMLMQNFFSMGLVSVLWAAVAFSLAFGDGGKFIGNFDFAGLSKIAERQVRPPGLRRRPSRLTHPPAGLLPLPVDVRHHHPRPDHRGDRRPGEVPGVGRVPRRLAPPRVRPGGPLGLLPHSAGCSRRVRSTSPAAPSSTSTPASPPWRPCWWPASARAGPTRRCRPTRCR